MVYWVPHWWSSEMLKWQAGLHSFIIFMVFCGWILKLVIIGTLFFVKEEELRNAPSVAARPSNASRI